MHMRTYIQKLKGKYIYAEHVMFHHESNDFAGFPVLQNSTKVIISFYQLKEAEKEKSKAIKILNTNTHVLLCQLHNQAETERWILSQDKLKPPNPLESNTFNDADGVVMMGNEKLVKIDKSGWCMVQESKTHVYSSEIIMFVLT